MPKDGMEQIPAAEMERVMRVQDVMLLATAQKITWWQAAEILGITVRTMRRWKGEVPEEGMQTLYDGPQRKAELAKARREPSR
jgi:hypothetical protein